MISKLSVFHFVEEPENPFGALKKSLRSEGEKAVAGSLIVLPEGFNLGRSYWPGELGNAEFTVDDSLKRLKSISSTFDVTCPPMFGVKLKKLSHASKQTRFIQV